MKRMIESWQREFYMSDDPMEKDYMKKKERRCEGEMKKKAINLTFTLHNL